MTANQSGGAGPDLFGTFWSEWVKNMTPSGMAAPPPSREATEHMRRVFFDMMASQADQVMRSEGFLSTMKQAMDSSLAWQKTINDMLQQGLAAGQMPSRADADHIVTLVRGMEERVLNKLDDITARVEQLENAGGEALHP